MYDDGGSCSDCGFEMPDNYINDYNQCVHTKHDMKWL